MPLTDPVPSSSFDVLERNVQDTDKFVNQETGTFTNRVGKVIKPIPVIEAAANAAVISLGWHQVGLFADGFTYLLQNDIAKDAAGDWYRWNGSLPKVVTAGTLPSSDVNFVKIDYKSHAELSDRNPADGSAHNADDIAKNGGGSVQDHIDDYEIHTRIFDNVTDMLAFNDLVADNIYTEGGNTWKYKGYGNGTISDFELLSAINNPNGLESRLTSTTISANEIISRTTSESYACIKSSPELQYIRLTSEVDQTKDLYVVINGQIGGGLSPITTSSQFYIVAATCDDISRNGSSTIVSPTITGGNGEPYKITIPSADLTKTCLSFDIRAGANMGVSREANFDSIEFYQDGKKLADTLFKYVRSSDEWTSGTRNTSFSEPTKKFLSGQQLTLSTSELVASNTMNIYTRGGDTYLGKTSLDFYNNVVRLESSPVLIESLILQDGEHKPYRKSCAIDLTKDLNIISKGGRATIMCADKVTPALASSTVVDYYTAPWNSDRHYDANVRSNAVQPKISLDLTSSTEALFKYQLSAAASVVEVQTTPKKYYYDGTLLHFSYPVGYTLPVVRVAVCLNGIQMLTSARSLSAVCVDIVGAEVSNWTFRPPSYVQYPLPSSKFVSLHDCGGRATSTGEGIRIDNLDHELHNFKSFSNGNDGINVHLGGRSYIKGGRTWNNAQDGVSHHEQQKGYIDGLDMRYNGAGNSTPAFGADVYHINCISVAASDGMTTKTYAGTLCALGNTAQGDAVAHYKNCITDSSLSPTTYGYTSVTLDAGGKSEVYVSGADHIGGNLFSTYGAGSSIIEFI